MKVYDILGKLLTTLVDEIKPAGTYNVQFHASNLPSGIYLLQMQAGNFIGRQKMMLLK
ncbi:T9SS type A sorting domain-containing protein [Bacteroidota bacterium]